MRVVIDGLSWILLMGGSIFALIGGIGVLRLPDVFARLHASGITDTLGAGMILGGLMLQGGFSEATVKLILVLLFLWFTSPVSTHALARAALQGGVQPLLTHDGRRRPASDP